MSKVILSSQQKPIPVTQNNGLETNLIIPTNDGLTFINISNIIYCKGDCVYTDYIIDNGDKITVSRCLKETSEMLEKHIFFRIHQSYLVNPKFIKKYNFLNKSITMSNGEKLPIARRKKDEFLEFIKNMQPTF